MLTTDQARERAQDIVARAMKAGADAADAILASERSLSVAVRLGALEEVSRSEGDELGLRVFVGRRSASVATSDMADSELDSLVERALAMAGEAPEDPWSGLAPESRLMHGAPPMLDIDDGGSADPAALKAQALAAEDAARAVDGVTNSEGGGAWSGRAVLALATSSGFAGAYSGSRYGVSASVLAGGEGGTMERDYAQHGARYARDVESPELVGRRAGERAVRRRNPARIKGGRMPVMFDPRVGASLVGHCISAISGPAITRKTSFLLDALGTQVFAPGVTIVDDPHRPRGLRSRPFDGEGLPVSPMRIIENGMLENWLLDSASARQLGLEPSGHAVRGGAGAPGVGTTNLYMKAGTTPPATLIEDIELGVYVTELIGQGVNGVTGDYSRGAAGFLIEKGEITRPVSEITIASNLKEMYRALTPANDLEFRYAVNVPTIRVDGMMVAGD